MKVRTASRSTGGVAISDSSRTPVSASCSVRGIGVADSVSTWTSALSSFSRSLCLTPKCCSSSTISRPRSRNSIALAEQRMRADDDVDRAVRDPGLDRGQLLRADQARGLARRLTGRPAKRVGEGLEVLAREQRRRHDDGHLLAGHGGDEGGAQRHLGLAEADVAADQPVHRPAGGEIVEHVVDGASLVLGLLVGEAGAELVVEALRRRSAPAPSFIGARGGDLDQLRGHVADALLEPRLARLPGDAAELVERDLGLLGAVARQQLDVLDRQVELVAAGIDDLEAVVRRAGRLDRLQPVEAADAVVDVDDEIALGEAGRLGR